MTDALAHSSTPTPQTDSSTMKRAMAAGIIGHFVEWYDYGVYAYVATTLAAVFYASSDPTAALLALFATFAVAFSPVHWVVSSSDRSPTGLDDSAALPRSSC